MFGLGPYFCSEINDLHILNATKGTFKLLISTFTEFSSEGICACSVWITILFSLVAMYKFADAPTKLFDASLESVSNSISKVGKGVLCQHNAMVAVQ